MTLTAHGLSPVAIPPLPCGSIGGGAGDKVETFLTLDFGSLGGVSPIGNLPPLALSPLQAYWLSPINEATTPHQSEAKVAPAKKDVTDLALTVLSQPVNVMTVEVGKPRIGGGNQQLQIANFKHGYALGMYAYTKENVLKFVLGHLTAEELTSTPQLMRVGLLAHGAGKGAGSFLICGQNEGKEKQEQEFCKTNAYWLTNKCDAFKKPFPNTTVTVVMSKDVFKHVNQCSVG